MRKAVQEQEVVILASTVKHALKIIGQVLFVIPKERISATKESSDRQ